MKVLFNATTLVMGGALQVAVAFIKQSLCDENDIVWYYALSKEVFSELSSDDQSMLLQNLTVLDVSPAKSRSSRVLLKDIEADCRADVVFTLFGPAYVKFTAPHICGVADGWVTHSSWLAFKSLSSVAIKLRMLSTILYKAIWYKKSNIWIVEAEIAKNGLMKRLMLASEAIYVIPNTCGQAYFLKNATPMCINNAAKIRLITMSAYYEHKDLGLIPEIARILNERFSEYEFEFVLTLPKDSTGYSDIVKKCKLYGVEKYICNVGPVPVSEGADVYEDCHIVFLPSLLETFSANYPEGMAMKMPIITTDMPFAHNACEDAALYFRPHDAVSAAEKIMQLVEDPSLVAKLVTNGSHVLGKLSSSENRYNHYRDVIKNLYGKSVND